MIDAPSDSGKEAESIDFAAGAPQYRVATAHNAATQLSLLFQYLLHHAVLLRTFMLVYSSVEQCLCTLIPPFRSFNLQSSPFAHANM